ncbi:hypothetical protein DFH09DRAFT_1317137 [Mycena vulgaris]|nr:hypothetical protein DFH09DRAFT_1317137 [Mycena vulgaris]
MTVSTGQSASANIISRLTHDTEPMIQERYAPETQSSKHVHLDPCLSTNPDFEDGVDSNTYTPDVHGPKSDSITPPPEIIHPERKASRIEVIGDSDSDGSAMPKKTQSKKKARAAEVVEMTPADHKLILMIPCAEQGTQRQQLTHATTFSEALDIIHETLGCADVDKKPALMASDGFEAIREREAEDWNGCPGGPQVSSISCRSLVPMIEEFQNAINAPERCPFPVIVAVHGLVLGLDVDIISACDIRYAAEPTVLRWEGRRRIRTMMLRYVGQEVDVGLAADIGTLAHQAAILVKTTFLQKKRL